MSKTPVQLKQLTNLPARNLIINGNFDFWQRGTSLASASNNSFLADRFKYIRSGTHAVTISRSTDVPTVGDSDFQSQYSWLSTVTTAESSLAAGSYAGLRHHLEGFNYQAIHARKARLQFWVKVTGTSVTGTYSLTFFNGVTGNRFYTTSYTIASAGVWQKVVIDLPLDTVGTWNFDNGRGLDIDFMFACGTTFQTSSLNSWSGTVAEAATGQTNNVNTIGNTFQLAQIALIPGDFSGLSFDIPFVRAGNTIQQELAMCQRYYYRPSFDDITTNGINYAILQCIAANNAIGPIVFPVSMRTAPTFSRVGGVVTNATNGGVALTNLTLDISTPQLGRINALTGGSLVAGNSTLIQRNSGTDYIDFSAEL